MLQHAFTGVFARMVVFCVFAFLLTTTPVAAREPERTAPWWKQQKMRFMWGQWNLNRTDNSDDNGVRLPRELFRNIAQAGGTIYVEFRGCYSESNAKFAKEFGMRYFAFAEGAMISGLPGGRRAIAANGEPTDAKKPTCPLDESIYRKWLVEPYLEGARQGLIDGIHVDWETYNGNGEPEICYCDDCFAQFMKRRGIDEAIPDKIRRFGWLKDRKLESAYEDVFTQRRIEMFARLRDELHAARADLLFSSYGLDYGRASDFARGVHTPTVPFMYVSSRHYTDHDIKPWWESRSRRWRQEGYLYIAGGWTQAFFGAQVSQVSAARWIYEAGVNEDGVWLWFERAMDDNILRAFAAADRDIKETERAAGDYLLTGERDPNFVTLVEWTGRPELQQAVIACTYHRNGSHLVHLNNVNAEWPLRVRVRFPRLAGEGNWTVRDPKSEMAYTIDGKNQTWTAEQLKAGVVVALEARSDAFLLVEPAVDLTPTDPAHLIYSREFETLPDHTAAAEHAGAVVETAMGGDLAGNLPLLAHAGRELLHLPKSGWRFKMDPADMGIGQKWFDPATSTSDWVNIETENFWGDKGGVGAGWYRRKIVVPPLPKESRIYLYFGAVDEQLTLWIDGKPAGERNDGPEGWDKPFALDVTGALSAGSHQLTMRVYNSAMAGGIWKPILLLAAPPPPAIAAGQLLYTATEPMGYIGAEGASTLGNAIRTLDLGRSTQRRIRQVKGNLWSPSYSPDGHKIAFVHDTGGRGQIFSMNADGSQAANLSNNPFCDRFPSWSPDGRSLAFLSDRDGDWDIWRMDADGKNQRRLAGNVGLDRAPAWSPDGGRIAFESHASGMPAVWIVNRDGSNPHPLIDPAHPPVMGRIEGPRTTKPIPPSFGGDTLYLHDPAWSPDGGRIAAIQMGGEIVTLAADGSDWLELVYLPYADNLCWSPDGKQLAATWRTAPFCTDHSGIVVLNADGTGEGTIGPHGHYLLGRNLVDVQPQGPRLSETTYAGPVHSWYSSGSAAPRRVIKTFTALGWSPDGGMLAFSSDLDPSGAFYVYTLPAAGGEPRRLDTTRSAWPQSIQWKPAATRF